MYTSELKKPHICQGQKYARKVLSRPLTFPLGGYLGSEQAYLSGGRMAQQVTILQGLREVLFCLSVFYLSLLISFGDDFIFVQLLENEEISIKN